MSTRTVFLARLLGPYFLIMAVAMFVQGDAFAAAARAMLGDAPLLLFAGIATVLGGLALVLVHNVWSDGILPVVVTLLGWATLLKGTALVLLPGPLTAFYTGALGSLWAGKVLCLVLGAYLSVAGFGRPLDAGAR